MQEEFLYLENSTNRMEQIYWKVPLASMLLAGIFGLTPFSYGYGAEILAGIAICFALPLVLLGIFSGKDYWYRSIKNKELPGVVKNYAVPKRAAAFESLKTFIKPDFFSNYPCAIGFSAANGEALWLEEESLKMGMAVFSNDPEQHLDFSFNILLQHLLNATAIPAVIIDLRAGSESSAQLLKIVSMAGRNEDLIQAGLEASSFCFNPFEKSYSTEAKAKKLILMANLLLNNSVAGSSLGAETEDFFFRLARCLDSFNPDWTLRHVSELLQDFQAVSSQLNRHFELTKQNQGVLDLAQIEKYLENADSNSQKLLKILSLALSAQFKNAGCNSSAGSGLKDFLSLGKVMYYSVSEEADKSATQLAAGLLAEELKSVFNSKENESAGSALILVIADQPTRIPNLEALTEVIKSERAIVVFSGGNWQPETASMERDFIDRKNRAILHAVYFNFQLSEKGQIFTQQGSISEFCPLKVSFV